MINKLIAEEFVEKAMKLINLNVNVMDNNGIIIASGEKSRIGTVHEGAMLAIKKDESVIISDYDIELLNGTKNGINIPIYCRGILEGVVGITGEGEEIANYGKLVKMTMELYLENEILVEEQAKDRNLREKFYLSLINNQEESLNPEIIEKYIHNIQLSGTHVVSIIKFIEKDLLLLNSLILSSLKIIESCGANFGVNLSDGKIAFICTDTSSVDIYNKSVYITDKLIEHMKKNNFINYRVFIGLDYQGKSGINQSYETALNLLETSTYDDNKVIYSKDMLLDVIIKSSNLSLEYNRLTKIWGKLVEEDKYSELRDTLNTYYNSNCESKISAEKLNIHRNTLKYRFDKIFNITKYNPRLKKDLFVLICSQTSYLNLKNDNIKNSRI